MAILQAPITIYRLFSIFYIAFAFAFGFWDLAVLAVLALATKLSAAEASAFVFTAFSKVIGFFCLRMVFVGQLLAP